MQLLTRPLNIPCKKNLALCFTIYIHPNLPEINLQKKTGQLFGESKNPINFEIQSTFEISESGRIDYDVRPDFTGKNALAGIIFLSIDFVTQSTLKTTAVND